MDVPSAAAGAATDPFEGFFRAEYPRLVLMLLAVTGDRHRAEDVAQEALWRAQQDWDRIAGYDRPGAWVRRVALHASAKVRRRQLREGAALARIGLPREVGDDSQPFDERLWRAVRALPGQQRWAVVLFYLEDLPVAEIAAILGCSDGTVKTHLSRARATLARAMGATRTEVTP